LAFGRKQMLMPRVLNLGLLVTDMKGMLARLIGEDIELTTDLPPGLWSVRADPGQIEQVLMNLAVNARDAMPEGGTVVFETRAVTLQAEDCAALPFETTPGPYVQLRVRDSGAGLSADARAHLFEPFFTTKAEGTGLGLAISRAIARAHDGDVTYARDGAATRFEMTLSAEALAVTERAA
jgi:signal transduction histidine kinase